MTGKFSENGDKFTSLAWEAIKNTPEGWKPSHSVFTVNFTTYRVMSVYAREFGWSHPWISLTGKTTFFGVDVAFNDTLEIWEFGFVEKELWERAHAVCEKVS